jgi:redox-sensing transcriptional repressor
MVIPELSKMRLLHIMRLLEERGEATITSSEVEALTGWSSHTIRKDISYLSEKNEGEVLGTSAGYRAELLIPVIKRGLGLTQRRRCCIVGLGRLGSAYLNFRGFESEEFELVAGFDSNVNRVELLKATVPLYPAYKTPEVIQRLGIEIALLCVPSEAAQACGEKLATSGIKGILNFAPVTLRLPPELAVRNMYLSGELRALAIHIGRT